MQFDAISDSRLQVRVCRAGHRAKEGPVAGALALLRTITSVLRAYIRPQSILPPLPPASVPGSTLRGWLRCVLTRACYPMCDNRRISSQAPEYRVAPPSIAVVTEFQTREQKLAAHRATQGSLPVVDSDAAFPTLGGPPGGGGGTATSTSFWAIFLTHFSALHRPTRAGDVLY